MTAEETEALKCIKIEPQKNSADEKDSLIMVPRIATGMKLDTGVNESGCLDKRFHWQLQTFARGSSLHMAIPTQIDVTNRCHQTLTHSYSFS